MLMSEKYRRPKSDVAHHARFLIRAYGICSAIRYHFTDEVTYIQQSNLLILQLDKDNLNLENIKENSTFALNEQIFYFPQ